MFGSKPPGLNPSTATAPAKPVSVAATRRAPTRSPGSGTASSVTKSGAVKNSTVAVAVAGGMTVSE